ncbi:hypothetical protein H6G54_02880 [Anabaena cylindrica FACHB-243]|uniref:hypothetical protein n=1 Tax=Anabaena TaxID=1163 RepID=UPI0003084FE6|nr:MULTISPECIES: hypothetical protein [Anabaena]MBD2416670.1 hypothetical protein [Anabaena cylindrica FACHB-243]MCM2409031.1 hypothetical protein [Anabaena sp. CCAP 1446/1C]
MPVASLISVQKYYDIAIACASCVSPGSIRQKSRRAAMNDQYMVSVLAASIANYSPLL